MTSDLRSIAVDMALSLLLRILRERTGRFPVPPQQSLDLGQDPGGLGPFIAMDDPASDDYIVRDISPGLATTTVGPSSIPSYASVSRSRVTRNLPPNSPFPR